jgi:hypothetical protein
MALLALLLSLILGGGALTHSQAPTGPQHHVNPLDCCCNDGGMQGNC